MTSTSRCEWLLALIACGTPQRPPPPRSNTAGSLSHSSPALEALAAAFKACMNRAYPNEPPLSDDVKMTFQPLEGHWLVGALATDLEIDLDKQTCDGVRFDLAGPVPQAPLFQDVVAAGTKCAIAQPWRGMGPAGVQLDLERPIVTRLPDGELLVTFHERDRTDSRGAINIAVKTCTEYVDAK